MRILQVTDGFTRGGLERFITDLSLAFRQSGHENYYVVGNNAASQEKLPAVKLYNQGFHFLDGANITIESFVSDIRTLETIIERHRIDCVIAHPFHCVIPATIAAHRRQIPIGYVIHGNLSVSFPSCLAENALFRALITHEVDAVFTVNEISNAQITTTNAPMVTIGQPIISIDVPASHHGVHNKSWAMVSRLDSDKSAGIKAFLALLPNLDIDHVDIYGTGAEEQQLQEFVVNAGLSNKVAFCGYDVDWLSRIDETHFGVIGFGRVALEATCAGKPVLMTSPYEYPCGMLTLELYEQASKANFNGAGLRKLQSAIELNEQLACAYADGSPPRALVEKCRADHSPSAIAETMLRNLNESKGLKMPHWTTVVEALDALTPNAQLFTDESALQYFLWYPLSYYPDVLAKNAVLAELQYCALGAAHNRTAMQLESTTEQRRLLVERIRSLEKRAKRTEKQLEKQSRVMTKQSEQIAQIKSSKSWKMGRAITAIPRWLKRLYQRLLQRSIDKHNDADA